VLQGVARKLVTAAETIAKERGIAHMYVHVVVDNTAARALYSACGFDVEREESADAARKRQHGRRLLLGKSL
jgi:ribosomal protein S18 acetylase RimI-like enzyme